MASVSSLAFRRPTAESLDIPGTFTEAFTAEDQRAVVGLIEWLNTTQLAERATDRWSQARLAKAAGVNVGTLNQILRGRYPSAPAEHIAKLRSTIERQQTRKRMALVPVPLVETSVQRRVFSVCKRAHAYHNFGVMAGAVGIGKTRALLAYAEQNAAVYYVRAMQGMTVSVLLDELVDATGATVHTSAKGVRGTQAERLAGVRRKLAGQDGLLILDEAERVNTTTLETLRYLRDTADVGVVLAGNESLQHTLRDVRGRFGQIRSRVGYWPAALNAITEEDAHCITRAAFEAFGWEAPSETVLDACWQGCDGSARVLAENLLPAVRDYIMRKHLPLAPELIFKAAQDILGFDARPRARS